MAEYTCIHDRPIPGDCEACPSGRRQLVEDKAEDKGPHHPLGCFDAQVWAKEFIRISREQGWRSVDTPGAPEDKLIDEGLMIGWFANAIMTGYDEAFARHRADLLRFDTQILDIPPKGVVVVRPHGPISPDEAHALGETLETMLDMQARSDVKILIMDDDADIEVKSE